MSSPRTRKKWRIWLTLTLGVLVLVYGAACLYIYLKQVELTFMPLGEVDGAEQKIAQTIKSEIRFETDDFPLIVGTGEEKGKVHGYWVPAKVENAPTFLYLHGQDATIDKNLEHTQQLHELGYNVLLIDYRGFGKTHGKTQPSEKKIYEDAEAAWQYLVSDKGIDPKTILIFGHSLGGAVAIDLAKNHPNAAGLVTVCTFTSIYEMSKLKYGGLLKALPMDLLLTERLDSISKIDAVKIPKLFIHGMKDEKVPYRMSEELFTKATPPKSLCLLPNSPHSEFKDPDLATMGDAIAKFVRESLEGTLNTSDVKD